MSQIKKVIKDSDKVAVIREIFGNQASGVLEKSGTLAYDFMYEHLEVANHYGFNYSNLSEFYNKVKKHVLETRPQDLAMYMAKKPYITDWATRQSMVKKGVENYKKVLKEEEKQRTAAKLREQQEKNAKEITQTQATPTVKTTAKTQATPTVKTTAKTQTTQSPTPRKIRRGAAKVSAEQKSARINGWLEKIGLTQEDGQKLLEKYGLDATYNIVQHSLLQPNDVMKEMGEKYKGSKGAVEYFINLDEAKMSDVSKLTGISLEDMTNSAKTYKPEEKPATIPLELPALETMIPEPLEFEYKRPDINIAATTPAQTLYHSLVTKKAKDKGLKQTDPEPLLTLNELKKGLKGIKIPEDVQQVCRLNLDKPWVPDGNYGDKKQILPKDLALALVEHVQTRENLQLRQKTQSR